MRPFKTSPKTTFTRASSFVETPVDEFALYEFTPRDPTRAFVGDDALDDARDALGVFAMDEFPTPGDLTPGDPTAFIGDDAPDDAARDTFARSGGAWSGGCLGLGAR